MSDIPLVVRYGPKGEGSGWWAEARHAGVWCFRPNEEEARGAALALAEKYGGVVEKDDGKS